MSLFDTLFPKQRHASNLRQQEYAGQATGRARTTAGRNRLRHLGHGEQLERRDLLAVSVVQETPTTFFTDFSRNFNSEYASYTITNIDSGPIDAWVKVTFPAGSVVGCGPGYNNEDGLYRVGTLNNGEFNEAFLYYTAKSNTAVAQPYSLEVWNGKPGDPGSSPLIPSPIALTYESIVDTLAAEPNKVSSVTISPAAPAVGDIMTMTVGGKLGSGANRVLFAPATRSDWQPDIFELRNVTNVISGMARTPDRIFYDGLPGGGSDEKPFTSVYEFLVTGPVTTPTPVDPTQWTQDGKQAWKHHKPDDTPFPPIPPVTYDLSISKTDGKATYTPGGTTTYTVTLLHTGKAAATNVVVPDVLPPQVDPTSTWTVTYSGGATSGPLPGGLGNGGTGNISGTVNLAALTGSVVITINAKILPGASGAMTNTVTAKAPGDDPISASDTNLDVNLSLTKNDGVTTYTPGGTTTYTIVLQNTGLAELNGITLKDELPDQIDQSSTWSAVYSGGASSGTLGNDGTGDFIDKTVNLGGLGGTVTITINAKILSSATGQMTNTIFATLATGGPPLSASDTNAPVPDERLTLTKNNGQTTYIPGTTTTYTIVLSNIGLSDVNGIIVSDTLPVQLDPLTTTWFATYTNASGTLPTVPTTGDILGTVTTLKGSVGVVTITINGNILSTATGDMVNTVTARNSVSLSATDRDTATPQVNLSVTKTDGTDTYIPGTSTTYTITINNSGPSFLDNGTISDLLPAPVAIAGTWTVFSSSGVGTLVTPSNGTGSISANLDLAAGGQVVIKYTVDTDSAATAPLINTVIVTPPQGQGSSTSDTDEDTAAPQVDLAVTKTRTSPLPVIAGEVVTYSIVVSSNGPSSITTFTGTDVSVPGLLSPTYSVDTGTYDPNTGIWTAAAGDTFDKGETVTFTFSGTVPAGATGTLTNTVTGTPPIFDPNPDNNTSTATDTIVVKPVLSITKTDNATTYVPGTSTTYTIVATNAGPSFLAGGTVSDPLPAQVSSATWTAVYSAGSSGPASGSGPLNETVNLAPLGTATFTFTVQIKPDATGDLVNTVTITPPPNTQGNTATATDTNTLSNPQLLLNVTKTDDKTTYLPNETFTYTIVVSNSGPSTMIDGIVNDPLAAQVATASWTASYTAGSSGPLSGSGGITNEKITLLPGGNATFLLTVTIRPDAFGQMDNTVTLTPPAGVVVAPGSVLSATDTNFGPEPPASIGAAIVVGSDDGCNGPPWVRVIDPNSGVELSRFLAYDSRFRGSVRVATGDVTGDGVAEIITAPSRNAIGEVRVFQRDLLGANQQNGVSEWTELVQYRTLAFGPKYRGGVEVAVADIDGDRVNDIVTAMSINAGMVNVFKVTPGASDPVANSPFKSFRGAPAGTNNGVMISAGDYIPGGFGEIAVGTNSGTRALVRIFDVSGTPTVVRSFNPFANRFRGGVTLSTADYDGNGSLDLIVGAGINGGSRVEVWNPATTTRIAQTSAFGSLAKPNARVFAVFGTAADGFLGPDSTLYGVQGLNGGQGSKGVWKVIGGSANSLVNSRTILPPLRIAPIGLPLAPIAPRLG
jgi:uncharacterized repeat protein (TIGR01451 family)